jgi:hypothetical protein
VASALATLQAVVDEAVADGRISERAVGEIEKRVNGALEKYEEGKTEEAIRELDELESKLDELEERDELSNQTDQRLERALQDLAVAMFLADPSAGDEDDD